MSSCGGVILFDNYDDTYAGSASQATFVGRPMKLQSSVLVVCKEGCLEYRTDCNKPLKLVGGDVVFCRQGQIVEFLGASYDTKVMFMAISQDLIISLERFMPRKDNSLFMCFTPPAEFVDEINTHYRLMKSSIEGDGSLFRESIISSYVYIILMKLIVAYNDWVGCRNNGDAVSSRPLEIYNRFVALVKEDFRRHRDVEHYASALFISSGHLSRIIKNVSGKTVGAWIRDYVILEAKIMLLSSDMTISQISENLNFPNPSFFSKYFRESTGMPPGGYRKS